MKQYKTALLIGAAVSFAYWSNAYAQDAAPANVQPEASSPPIPPVPTALNDGSQISDIVVTATRRGESLQKVPIAISAFGAQELAATGTTNAQELAAITPGLTIANQSAAVTPFIRGVGAVDNTVGQEAAVATYVDGVYITSVYGSLFTFNNIERIEVLKGPQGTLFGRNATGGLIHVITRDPGQDTRIEGAVNYGSYNTIGGRFYASTGLTENLAADVAMVYRHQYDGWGRNVNLNRDIGFAGNDFAIRSKIVLTPDSDTKIKLAIDYSNSKGGDIGSVKNVQPGSIGADGLSATPGFNNDRAGYDEYVNTRQGGVSLTINHEFDAFSVNSVTAYRKTKVVQAFDNDATPVRKIDVLIDNQTYRTFTQEVQVLSNPSSPIKWIVGGFFMHDKSGFDGPVGLGLYGEDLGGTGVLIKGDITTTSLSAFGEVTVPLGETTAVVGGIRYTSDKRSIAGQTVVVDSNVPGSQNVLVALPATSASFRESQPTWRLILNHNFTPAILGYASYNRGFKSGNFNTAAPADKPFHSEILDAFEVGAKTQFFDNKLRFNMAAFYYKYDNLQLNKLTGATLLTTNAASAEIKGLDFDGELVVTNELRLRFGGALLDAKFKDFTGAQYSFRNPDGTTTLAAGGPLGDLSGNRLTRSPKATFNIGAFARIPAGSGNIVANANYVYNSGYYWEPDNRLKQKAYGLVNAQLGWSAAEDRWAVKVIAKNLSGTKYDVWQVATTNGDLYAPAAPRTIAGEISFKF
jgi:iron complex outermembrane receptor protein